MPNHPRFARHIANPGHGARVALAVLGVSGVLGCSPYLPGPQPGLTPEAPRFRSAPPLTFEVNHGQSADEVQFLARGPGHALFLTDSGATSRLDPSDDGPSVAIRMSLRGASERPRLRAEGPRPGKLHYLRGSQPEAWQRNVPTFDRVRYEGVYPGIDWVFRDGGGELEYDFEVAPGADPRAIRIHFAGSEALRLDASGSLIVDTAAGELRHRPPVLFQEGPEGRESVPGRYALAGRELRFDVGDYDRSRRLVIDPVFLFSAFVGGGYGENVALAPNGDVLISGWAAAPDFPTTPGAYDSSRAFNDAFVARVSSDGRELRFATFLGGSGQERSSGLGVGPGGEVWVSGTTSSTDFPTSPNAHDAVAVGAEGFVAQLSAEGSELLYGSYLGGSGTDEGKDLSVDAKGFAYVAGSTQSEDFPVTAGAFDTEYESELEHRRVGVSSELNFRSEGFVVKIAPKGKTIYASYLGGPDGDGIDTIAHDGDGAAYVSGWTLGDRQTTTEGALDLGGEAFTAKISRLGNELSHYARPGLAGPIGVDASGASYIASYAFLERHFDVRVVKIDPTGSHFRYDVVLGGSTWEDVGDIAVTPEGRALLTGTTDSPDFPLRNDNTGPAHRGGNDVYLSILSPSGELLYSTLLGGSANDWGRSLAAHVDGSLVIGGWTDSNDFPVTDGALRERPSEGPTAYVASLDPDSDGDGITDSLDNCRDQPNPDQFDADGDGQGARCDACDDRPDRDGDGICDDLDNCEEQPNPEQADRDRDGLGDACDSCTDSDGDGFGDPVTKPTGCGYDNCWSVANPEQTDTDGDGAGDACDDCNVDEDDDGICDDVDNCPGTANPEQLDSDGDGSGDACDNCKCFASDDQTDSDGDGAGDACDRAPTVPVGLCRSGLDPGSPTPFALQAEMFCSTISQQTCF